ncbi:MAG: hypothetical protein KF768_00615 [Phycisphaeraceae bacterium]|nr:hypothetical protein [Phycisphaeraceae bacterium]
MSRGTRRTGLASALRGGMAVAVAMAMGVAGAAGAMASPPSGSHAAPGVVGGGSGGGIEGLPDDPFIRAMVKDPNDPTVRAFAAAQKVRRAEERELKKLRFEHFRSTRNVEVRQIGIQKLRAYTDPAVFPALLKLFEYEDRDVRGAILDHLRDQQTDEADATIAWSAVFDRDEWFRAGAGARLKQRALETGGVSNRVKTVAAYGLRNADDAIAANAAALINTLNLIEAIPALVNAQVLGGVPSQTAADGGEAALAYILVGTQQAFVADLTPVVGDSAVAFDPTLGIVTDGVVLRVIDAVVITYRTEIHRQLVGLADRNWSGSSSRSTASMGYDQQKWWDWYVGEFLPEQAAKRRAEMAAPAPTPSPAREPTPAPEPVAGP